MAVRESITDSLQQEKQPFRLKRNIGSPFIMHYKVYGVDSIYHRLRNEAAMDSFYLEKAIEHWKRELLKYQELEPGTIEELENHLRDSIDHHIELGSTQEEAFNIAVDKIAEGFQDAIQELRYTSANMEPKPKWRSSWWIPALLPNILKVLLRNFKRQPGYSFINISGLAIGMASAILVLFYVKQELSFDNFHTDSEDIYRVVKTRSNSNGEFKSARSQVPMGPAIEENFPEIESAVRFWKAFQPVVGFEGDYFNEDGFYFTDSKVFDLFTFEMVNGNPNRALSSPGTVVITESTAKKYFGNQNPIGELLSFRGFPEDSLELTVTGVIKDLPANTHFKFDFLASALNLETEKDNWGSHKSIWLYVSLVENTDIASLERKLGPFVDEQAGTDPDSEFKTRVHLEPLSSIHLYSEFEGGFKPNGAISYIYLFSSLAIILLIIGCINFINLATANGFGRAKEIGIRKANGSLQSHIVFQFLGETLLMTSIAGAIGLFLGRTFAPFFNRIGGINIQFERLLEPGILLSILMLILTVTILAGSYPAIFLSRFKPISIFKSGPTTSKKTALLRRILVVFQFTISIVLIIGTTVMYKQLSFIQNKNLGFEKEHILVVPYPENEATFVESIKSQPGILDYTISKRVPVNDINYDSRTFRIPDQDVLKRFQNYVADEFFLSTYGMELKAGRNFNPDIASDRDNLIINESAVRELGWGTPENALNKSLEWNRNSNGVVIGVVADFHSTSLYEVVDPLVLSFSEGNYWKTFISLKISPQNVSRTRSTIEELWKEASPKSAFYSFFIDDSLVQLHDRDSKLLALFSFLSILAIIISSLGLFGLTSFLIVKMQKTIAIHKVLGAGITQIVGFIAKNFFLLILISFLIAIPVSIFGIESWLQNFAYKVGLGFQEVLFAGLVICGSTILTISYQTIKASIANPIKSLRSE